MMVPKYLYFSPFSKRLRYCIVTVEAARFWIHDYTLCGFQFPAGLRRKTAACWRPCPLWQCPTCLTKALWSSYLTAGWKAHVASLARDRRWVDLELWYLGSDMYTFYRLVKLRIELNRSCRNLCPEPTLS